jgi:hypothetical protein
MTCRMRVSALASAAVVLALLTVPAAGSAQQTQTPSSSSPTTTSDGGSRFGLGFQSSWPAYGLSGIYDVNDRITAQAVLGALGAVTTVSGRGLYHFSRQEKYSLFGFGTVGLWRYSYDILGHDESESTVGVGGGAGVELDWQGILDEDDDGSFPPLYSTIDLGLTMASFDAYNWNAFGFGVGLHYRF